jgi:hypothetical protein
MPQWSCVVFLLGLWGTRPLVRKSQMEGRAWVAMAGIVVIEKFEARSLWCDDMGRDGMEVKERNR